MSDKARYFLAASIAVFTIIWIVGEIRRDLRDQHRIMIQLDSSGRIISVENRTGVIITNLHFEVVNGPGP